ncbi:MAG: LytTR family DNA-binding domain-containing protein [Bacilli bacterium]
MIIKVAIIEDDSVAYENLKSNLVRYGKENNREIIIKYFPDGLKFLSDYKPDYDLVFLDINLPFMDGMTVAKKMRSYDPKVGLIFVTDLAQFAIKGYEVDAYDFIVKPVVYDHLAHKLSRFCEGLEKLNSEPRITLKIDDGFIALTASSIKFVEILDHRLYYHTDKGVFNAYGSLSDIEKILPADAFVRCNHCYLVNLKFVTGIDKFEASIGEDKLQISHPKKKAFLDAFTNYLGTHS